MPNPYEPPDFSDQPYLPPSEPTSGSNLVPHVRIVAVCMIVQGVLELLMGAFLIVVGIAMPMLMQAAAADDPAAREAAEQFEQAKWVMIGFYIAMGIPALIAGILHVVAGLFSYGYKRRILAISALGIGLLSLSTCYCAPTSIGLAIYGLIVFLNPEVVRLFDSRSQANFGKIP